MVVDCFCDRSLGMERSAARAFAHSRAPTLAQKKTADPRFWISRLDERALGVSTRAFESEPGQHHRARSQDQR